jgi:hypothetical protein
MALLLGDIHGNLDKAKAFIAYRPEEKHVFVGDYVDSFTVSDMDVYNTLKACIESDSDLILGNHDLGYFYRPPFDCSGFRISMMKGLQDIFEEFLKEKRFVPALLLDGFIVTHGGVSDEFGGGVKFKDPGAVLDKINAEWDEYLELRHTNKRGYARGSIFKVGYVRGGRDDYSGIFWADYRYDSLLDVPQIFGHSKTESGDIISIGNKPWWALGCDNNRRICFNSTTRTVESF